MKWLEKWINMGWLYLCSFCKIGLPWNVKQLRKVVLISRNTSENGNIEGEYEIAKSKRCPWAKDVLVIQKHSTIPIHSKAELCRWWKRLMKLTFRRMELELPLIKCSFSFDSIAFDSTYEFDYLCKEALP